MKVSLLIIFKALLTSKDDRDKKESETKVFSYMGLSPIWTISSPLQERTPSLVEFSEGCHN